MKTPMTPLAYRGDGASGPTHLPLPPARSGLVRGRRLRKQWRYVGVWGEAVSICAARVTVGPVPQEFWAVWDRDLGKLHEHTRLRAGRVGMTPGRVRVRDGDNRLDLRFEEDPTTAIEVMTPVPGGWTWTRKQIATCTGSAMLAGRRVPVDGLALIDDSDGYHPRSTHWWWSAGTAALPDGRTAAWSVVVGINDTMPAIENTLWIDGRPQPIGPVSFLPDLSGVEFADGAVLTFTPESERASRVDLLVISSVYRQPFGTFTGTLPGGYEVSSGYGVMEDHRALW
ncbi:MAG: DUF2804 family protein [Propionibacteriaceae bacterium]